jgi:hypothetical protein
VPTCTEVAVSWASDIEREAKLAALHIEQVKLEQAKIELSRAEVDLKSKLVEYRIKRMTFWLAALGVPGTVAALKWGWAQHLARWIAALIA